MASLFTDLTPLGWQIADTLPFVFAQDAGPLSWQEVARDEAQIRYRHADLELIVHVERLSEYRAVVLRMHLTNHAATPSAPFTRLQPLHLCWQCDQDEGTEAAHIHTVGGGLNESNYPPDTLRQHTVRADGSGYVWMEQGHDGRSSNERIPLMAVSCGSGVVIAGLEWSGMWWMDGRIGADGQHRLSCRIPVAGVVLDPGETLKLPPAHFIFCDGDFAAASNACRRYLGEQVVPPLADGPVRPAMDYNHWFGLGPDIDETLMRRQTDRAAELGCEHVILDAGWYGGCIAGDFCTGVGNWDLVDADKFPGGLEPLAEHIRARGLKFGLWFEVERAHRQSRWVQEHPEWFFDVGGDYLHLDLTHPAAWQASCDVISDAVQRLDLRWLKLDYNIGPRPFWEHHDPTGKYQFAYVERLYAFFDALRERHPQVILENCASGGRRIDLGTLRHTHIANLTDHTASAEICRFTSLGAHTWLPGHVHVIGLPFGRAEVGTTRHQQQLSAHDLLTRLAGMPTLYGDIAALSDADVQLIQRLRAVYDQYADLLSADCYRLLPQPNRDDEDEIVQFVSPDGSRAVVLAYPGYDGTRTHRLPLRGLDPQRSYRVADPLDVSPAASEISGHALLTEGLELTLAPRASLVRLVTAAAS